MTSTALTKSEQAELIEHEAAIESSKANIGGRLKKIRDKKLYRAIYKTFESYLDNRWGISRSRGYELIDVADVTENLRIGQSENVRHGGQKATEPNARQARELAKAPPEEQAEVWEEVVETTAKPTAKAIKGVVEERKKAKESKPEPEPESPPASIVLDPIKREVPESLRERYAVATELAAIGRKLDGIKREVVQYQGVAGAEFLPITAIELAIRDLKDSIVQAGYWTACPRCGGKGCSRCDKTGFVPKSRKGQLSHEDKEILGL